MHPLALALQVVAFLLVIRACSRWWRESGDPAVGPAVRSAVVLALLFAGTAFALQVLPQEVEEESLPTLAQIYFEAEFDESSLRAGPTEDW